MEKYKYRALNSSGRPIKGVLSAANENDLFNQLQQAGLELVNFSKLSSGVAKARMRTKITVRDLIQLFIHLDQMDGAGVPLLDSLADIRDTTENAALRDAISEIFRDVSDGSSLSEAMGRHPKIFTTLYLSLIASGEATGKMSSSYRQLVKYLKWLDVMQSRVRKATRYPMVLIFVVVAAVTIMMGFVVPQIVEFIRNMDFELPFATVALIVVSDFFQKFWWVVLGFPVLVVVALKVARRSSTDIALKMDRIILELPMAGPLVRKINIGRFCQTFGALYIAGLPILTAIKSASNTVSNLALLEALEHIQGSLRNGSPLSEAFNSTGEFPSLVIRMVKVGEESGNLGAVLEQVSDFYTADVDEEVQKLIAMIEPSLTMVLGLMILWIAVGVFGPIYSSFENMQF
ncbi:MAG: type II secretion system F family protein [Micavibrio aeruginosavorus]|uniref:Type II secretion system F family protein n=1 Tax=Micavibrio aeruginosavorus TaxID=349221 RepID=A0A2W5BY90_9BACT|nr:MAG: type II secretion system F family protein [Micavibrio aeruginosavorus]